MIIAVTTITNQENTQLDERFGRAEYFYIFDTNDKKGFFVENIAKFENEGAGGKAAKSVFDNKATVLITGELGNKAKTALNSFEIKSYKFGELQTINQVIENFENNKLMEI